MVLWKKNVNLFAVVFLLELIINAGSNTSHAQTYTDDQLDQLLLLPGTATEDDINDIFGRPSWNKKSKNETTPWQRALGAPVYYWSPPDAKNQTLSYFDSPFAGERIFVTRDGTSVDFFWMGRQVQPASMYDSVWTFNRTMSVTDLKTRLGYPDNRTGPIWTYNFLTPDSFRQFGVNALSQKWFMQSGGMLVYDGVSVVSVFGFEFKENKRDKKLGSFKKSQSYNKDYSDALLKEVDRLDAVNDSRLGRAEAILRQLEAASVIKVGPVPVSIYQSPDVRAFRLWDAKRKQLSIGMTTGLADRLTSDDEWAFVLAQQLSHIIQRHSLFTTDYVLETKYGPRLFRQVQGREHTADVGAILLVSRSGYDHSAADTVLTKLQQASPPLPDYIESAHPLFESRRLFLKAYLAQALPLIVPE